MKFLIRAIVTAHIGCVAANAANLTTTNVQNAGLNWNAVIWKTNGAGTAVGPPVTGNLYQTVANGISIGNGASNTRIRNPASAGLQTFPGDSLTMNTNTELRAKTAGAILDFPGVGGNPGLILDGGMLNGGDDAIFAITGRVHVASQSYISHGANGGGGGISPNRAFNFTGVLSGSGNLVFLNGGTTFPQQIVGNSNKFSGQWIVQCGWLFGVGIDSLGTNSITVDPLYTGYLAAMPNATSPVAAAWFEVGYNLNSAGGLTLTNGGLMKLHQNCVFSAVRIEGVSLSSGTHYYAELAADFPSSFALGGSGSLTIQPYGAPPPIAPTFDVQPSSVTSPVGSFAQLTATVSGTAPLTYRWQKGTNGIFINASDTGNVSGSTTGTLTFNPLALGDSADYRLVVTNSTGSATSQVATVTAFVSTTTNPIVAALNPPASATVSSLTQIQVTFSTNVVGVDAEDLQIDGLPAASVFGSGASYTFSFTQPLPGTILIYWDVDSAITDLSGNRFDPSLSWTYTVIDNIPPTLESKAPVDGAIVSRLTQAQVIFSEPVNGVDAADLLINGIAATNVTGNGFGPYVFQFPQPAPGTVQFSWAGGHGIRDLSSASNLFVGAGWTVALNSTSASMALTNIVINEFLTANVNPGGLQDEDGQLSDWIEIYNRGTATVNLGGWSLTDSADEPARWIFPATNIAPGQFLIVFASGKDRHETGANLHTSFALNSAGDYLGLYNSDSPPRLAQEFAPEFPEQRNDYSYGIDGGNGQLRYFSFQTPGATNSSSTLTGVVAAVHFNVNHGFFNQPFNLVLTTTTPGATIVYSTNGSVPAINGGATNGIVYTGPITINKTTALRAVGVAPDRLPSLVGSRSYFFIEDVIRQPPDPVGYPTGNVWTPTPGIVQTGSRAYYQMDPVIVDHPQYSNTVRAGLYSIPTMSLMLPIADLFDANDGIYSHPQSRGAGWERACSMELVFPDGDSGRQQDCGLQIQGGTQRDPGKNAKHSFRVNFKGDYGASKLNFNFFPESPVSSFNTLVLDGGINYWWHYVGGSSPADQRFRAQCVRDQYASDLMEALGHPSFLGRFYHVYLNGLYWGIHYIHERSDEDFAASHFGGNPDDYDVLRNTTVGLEIVAGDSDAWNAALSLSDNGLTNNAQYAQLQDYVDVDNLIDNMIVNHWVGNDDWPQHNWYVVRKRGAGEGFKFLIWDAEHVLKDVNINRTTVNAAGSPAQIYNALRNNAEFRLRFADHLQKHFSTGGVFFTDPANPIPDPAHPERNVPAALYLKRINEIDTAIVDESARWGGYTLTTNYTRNDHWLRELNNLLGYTNNAGNTANYFPQRSANVLNQYRSIGLFPGLGAPVLNSLGGNVPIGFSLSMTNPNAVGRIYYTTNGTDPRVYGSGSVAFGALSYTNGSPPVILHSSVIVNARVWNAGNWSALNQTTFTVASPGIPVRFTEIMYNPVGGDAFEFIELQNIGDTPVDLSGFSFEGVTFVVPNGTSVPAGGIMVFASSVNPSAFAARYPGVAVAGYYSGQLSNSGERVALRDQNGNTVVSVDYKDSGGWSPAADGSGDSLEILNPNGDPDDPANWRASLAVNGSPGAVAPTPSPPSVRLNEVMADNGGVVTNGGTFPDWVELYNAGTNSVSLSGWSLSNSGNPRKYIIPNGTNIAAGSYLVIWCDSQTNAPGLHSGFNLGRTGENLFLYDANTNRIDAFSFGLQLSNYTVGRFGADAAWQLTQPTPSANNVTATLGSPTNLVINEWLANATLGESDWIELYNTSSNRPVALAGLNLVTSNATFQIRAQSFLGPREFLQLFADETPGFDHLDFKLTAAGDAIALLDSSGGQIDRVTFANQTEGVSEGRLPNGGATILDFPGTASPGAANYVSTYAGPRLNEVQAQNTSIYDSRGNTPDWIEIYNPNPTNFSLAGMSLSTDPTKPGQWIIPAGVIISANNYFVIWFDSSRPASTNSTAELNTGRALSADGDAVYLFNSAGQIVDSVTFGFQIADLSIGKNGGSWNLLSNPTPGATNAANAILGNTANLRINEWMANPASGNDWFELYNLDAAPVALAGLYLTDDPSITGMTNSSVTALSFIAGRGWVKLEADSTPSQGPNHVKFSLDKDGETIRLYSAALALIDAVDLGLQSAGVSQGRLPDGGSNIVGFTTTPTPDASNYLPLSNVLINEVLTHTDPPLEDAIELYNASGSNVNVGGWFISNSQTDFKKYRIANGTSINSGSYKVFYEYQFNTTNAVPFTLNSAQGDSVLLSEADGSGNLTGFRSQISFPAAQNGVSFGRFPTSVGVDFVAQSTRSFGADNPVTLAQFRTGTGLTNVGPKIGPVVLSEIMYHPVTVAGTNSTENPDEEFVELFNFTTNAVPLYDPLAVTNHWKLGGGIDFVFPANVTLPAGGFAVVVDFDPTNVAVLMAFRSKYGVATNVPIYGPYSGKLSNGSETVELYQPDPPQTAPHPDAGFVPYILVDSVSYSTATPWPTAADGTGQSLQRRYGGDYGNEPLNWFACNPNPGKANCLIDSDGDGLPDDWEIANGLDPHSAAGNQGANGNPDGDGFTNLQEYLAGTNPLDPQDYLKFTNISRALSTVSLSFKAVAGHSYSILYRSSLENGNWQKLTDLEAPVVTGFILVNDPVSSSARFYRLVTPKLP